MSKKINHLVKFLNLISKSTVQNNIAQKLRLSEPLPSTSALNKRGGAINLKITKSDQSSEDIQVKYCVYDFWEPKTRKTMRALTFVDWAKCDFCRHWIHLKFCAVVRYMDEYSEFRCFYCEN